jgi:4-alpha-glucanotransferase
MSSHAGGEESLALADLAARAGVAVDWTDARGRHQRVADDVLRTLLDALGLPGRSMQQIQESLARVDGELRAEPGLIVTDVTQSVEIDSGGATAFELEAENGARRGLTAHTIDGAAMHGAHASGQGSGPGSGMGRVRLPAIETPGYYTLRGGEREWRLAVAPSRCPSLAEIMDVPQARAWGVSVQVYSLRRGHGDQPASAGGMGDFTALARFATAAASRGASAVAISPVHAMFAADPGRYSPYAPSSRLFLNALYVDPTAALGAQAASEAAQALQIGEDLLRLDGLALIDWPAVARLRLRLLRRMYDDFRGNTGTAQYAAFQAFRLAGGEALESHARFEALHARHAPPMGDAFDWRLWPADVRDPTGAGVRAYAHTHDKEVSFHIFLQWLAAHGLEAAQTAARNAGMAVGLISDLAVGTDPGGSHAWSRQDDILEGLSCGAPPDVYNPLGQSWGLTAFSPRALRLHGYGAFIEMLRASLRQAGGVRIDHILGLARMWLVPQGASARDGAYVRYPLDDILRLVALEAWRHRAIVVGENLGTVPEGFNDSIERAGVLGMSVLWFQRDELAGQPAPFQAPGHWPGASMATTTTHDLPTVTGWWNGRDLDWRAQLELLGEDETIEGLRQQREQDRGALWRAMRAAGAVNEEAGDTPPAEAPVRATLRFVASTPAPLMLAPVEDLLALPEQPNLPGTVDEHPNWRRRLPVDVADLFGDEDVRGRLAAITEVRRTL